MATREHSEVERALRAENERLSLKYVQERLRADRAELHERTALEKIRGAVTYWKEGQPEVGLLLLEAFLKEVE